MTYREDARTVAKETRWTVFRFLGIFLFVVILLAGLFFGGRSLGIWGKTTVEREVFEASYQRSESLVSEIATNEAAVAEIERKLQNPNLSENDRYNLDAQLSAARIRLQSARSKQQ